MNEERIKEIFADEEFVKEFFSKETPEEAQALLDEKEIDVSIEDEPPLAMKEGGIIKAGYNEDVDKLRSAKTEGKTWLAQIEEEEREKTGIKNLRIKFNKVDSTKVCGIYLWDDKILRAISFPY